MYTDISFKVLYRLRRYTIRLEVSFVLSFPIQLMRKYMKRECNVAKTLKTTPRKW